MAAALGIVVFALFGSPDLAQYVLDKKTQQACKAYTRLLNGKNGILAEAAVRRSIAARLNETDSSTRSGDTDGRHTLRHRREAHAVSRSTEPA
jgi:hypothetical protein